MSLEHLLDPSRAWRRRLFCEFLCDIIKTELLQASYMSSTARRAPNTTTHFVEWGGGGCHFSSEVELLLGDPKQLRLTNRTWPIVLFTGADTWYNEEKLVVEDRLYKIEVRTGILQQVLN